MIEKNDVEINIAEASTVNMEKNKDDSIKVSSDQKYGVAPAFASPSNTTDQNKKNDSNARAVTYGIEDNPPIHLGILLGLQVRFDIYL